MKTHTKLRIIPMVCTVMLACTFVSCGDDEVSPPPQGNHPSTEDTDYTEVLGTCENIVSCDPGIDVEFCGCYRRGGTVKVAFEVTNLTENKNNGFKVWTLPAYTYFTDNEGNTYNKDTDMSVRWGGEEGNGDMMAPISSGGKLYCEFTIRGVASSAESFTVAHIKASTYGTGDFTCKTDYINLYDVEWHTL